MSGERDVTRASAMQRLFPVSSIAPGSTGAPQDSRDYGRETITNSNHNIPRSGSGKVGVYGSSFPQEVSRSVTIATVRPVINTTASKPVFSSYRQENVVQHFDAPKMRMADAPNDSKWRSGSEKDIPERGQEAIVQKPWEQVKSVNVIPHVSDFMYSASFKLCRLIFCKQK